MNLDRDEILSASELCRLLRITRPTLYSWIKVGKLRPWKRLGEGSSYLFLRSELAHQRLKKYSRAKIDLKRDASPLPAGAAAGVLLVSEDGACIRQILAELKRQNCQVSVLKEASRFAAALREERPELVIVDLDWKGLSGWDLFEKIRKGLKKSGEPPAQLLLSGQYTRPEDAARALRQGASDFLRKPFAGGVLTARVRRILRSRLWSELDIRTSENVLISRDGNLSVERDLQTLVLGDLSQGAVTRTRLTRKEADLLCLFLKRPGRIFSKTMLLEVVWGYVTRIKSRTLDCHIMTLRKKLGPQRDRIETYYGLGYRFIDKLAAAD